MGRVSDRRSTSLNPTLRKVVASPVNAKTTDQTGSSSICFNIRERYKTENVFLGAIEHQAIGCPLV